MSGGHLQLEHVPFRGDTYKSYFNVATNTTILIISYPVYLGNT
jgi:hypothetical protein